MCETIEVQKVDQEENERIWQLKPCFVKPCPESTLPGWTKVKSELASDVLIALSVVCIDREECPSVSEWAAFGLITGVLRTITGSSYAVGESLRFQEKAEIDFALFGLLERASSLPSAATLEPDLLLSVLNLAYPSYHDMAGMPMCNSYSESPLRTRWDSYDINPSFMRSIGYVDEGWHKYYVENVQPRLSETMIGSIQHCMQPVQKQMKVACAWVRAHYRW